MSFVRGQANLQSKGASQRRWPEKENDRLRVDAVKNKPGLAPPQN